MTGNIRRPRRRAFTLVELVMVVTIIGIIAAMAVPRMGIAASKASAHALEATVNGVRRAIDVYYAEHGLFPGYDPSNGSANGDWFVKQLLRYSDRKGTTQATLSAPYVYGPYLRAPFPKNPANKRDNVYVKTNPGDPNPASGSYGWVAVLSTGDFGVIANDVELEKIGVTETAQRTNLRIGG